MPRVNFDEWAETRCRKCCWIGDKDRLITFCADTKARCPRCLSADVVKSTNVQRSPLIMPDPTEQIDAVKEARELFEHEPPWTVEVHNARGDYAEIALVRRDPSFECGYYVIAKDEMRARREQAITDYKMLVRCRELLKALSDEVAQLRRGEFICQRCHLRKDAEFEEVTF